MMPSEKSTHAFGTAFASAVALAGFLLILVEAGSFGVGARLFPRLLGMVGGLSAAALLGQSCMRILAQRRGPASRGARGALDWRDVVISYIGPPAYAGLLYLLGFWIASVLGLAGLLVLLGERRPLVVLALTAGTLLAIYLMFEFSFGIRMPEGVLLAA
jgi:hypothetical protein